MIPGMSRMSFHLYCQRIDASRDMARYYMLAIQPTLFGETAVERSWDGSADVAARGPTCSRPNGKPSRIFSNLRAGNVGRAIGRTEAAMPSGI
ncbi:hypothetical protein GCM10007919_23470 [Rhizobium indigoferae]|nr:hypothetical protein GCM10007919_23470 [Rhizobium indigoferae]